MIYKYTFTFIFNLILKDIFDYPFDYLNRDWFK